ncbi:MAG: tetratricopeptide repeat protein [Candidatus Obscuribacterales bacterium]|nr:tetratricopeptide repeat protein [Candidatus Obscuribacterales bacterium]
MSRVKKLACCLFILLSSTVCLAQEDSLVRPPSGVTPQTVSLFNKAADDLNSKRYQEASDKFGQIVRIAPNFAEAHLNYGTSLQGIGAYKEALSELRTAISMKPDMPNVLYSLGTCYQNLGDLKAAINAYKQYLRAEPRGTFVPMAQSSITVLETELQRTSGLSSFEDSSNYLAEVTQNGMVRWPESRMPIRIYIKPGDGVPGYRPAFAAILRQSFQEWVDASRGKIRIAYTNDPQQAAVKCHWTNNTRELSTLSEGGQAIVVPDNLGARSTTLVILTVFPLSNSLVSDGYVHRVCLHEVGHAFGLYGHSRSPEDAMFGTIRPDERGIGLTSRDRNTIYSLYAMPAEKFANQNINMSRVAMSGDPSSPLNRSIAMNAEGVEILKQKNYPLALQKFETALQIYPANEFVQSNIAVCYSSWGADEANTGHYEQAVVYLKKSIEILELQHDKERLPLLLKNLSLVLRKLQRTSEAVQIEAKLKSL